MVRSDIKINRVKGKYPGVISRERRIIRRDPGREVMEFFYVFRQTSENPGVP